MFLLKIQRDFYHSKSFGTVEIQAPGLKITVVEMEEYQLLRCTRPHSLVFRHVMFFYCGFYIYDSVESFFVSSSISPEKTCAPK